MATLANDARPARVTDVGWLDQLIAAGAVLMLIATITALLRGQARWDELGLNVWAHLATILIALVLTPVMLLRRRGDRLHRGLGYIWVIAMGLTAAISFDIRLIMVDGRMSPIHVLSAGTLIAMPRIVYTARKHDHRSHRRVVRLVAGSALLIAGFFTFPFNRLLGHWLFG